MRAAHSIRRAVLLGYMAAGPQNELDSSWGPPSATEVRARRNRTSYRSDIAILSLLISIKESHASRPRGPRAREIHFLQILYSTRAAAHLTPLRRTSEPPGPIFYYGDLYGGIRTPTKYNTTLVTCDRFSTSSAAAPNIKIRCSGVFAALFLGWGWVLPRKFRKF
jgi:hypothetical protein